MGNCIIIPTLNFNCDFILFRVYKFTPVILKRTRVLPQLLTFALTGLTYWQNVIYTLGCFEFLPLLLWLLVFSPVFFYFELRFYEII